MIVNQRAPIKSERGVRANDIENRGKDVDAFDDPIHDLAPSLTWQFYQKRYPKDVGKIAVLLRLAPEAAFAVTRTMIGCNDDERLVINAHLAQPRDQITEQTVHEPNLCEMSLMERIGERRTRFPEYPRCSLVYVGAMVRTAVPPPRRDEFEWHMRQQEMDEVQPCRPTVDRR